MKRVFALRGLAFKHLQSNKVWLWLNTQNILKWLGTMSELWNLWIPCKVFLKMNGKCNLKQSWLTCDADTSMRLIRLLRMVSKLILQLEGFGLFWSNLSIQDVGLKLIFKTSKILSKVHWKKSLNLEKFGAKEPDWQWITITTTDFTIWIMPFSILNLQYNLLLSMGIHS